MGSPGGWVLRGDKAPKRKAILREGWGPASDGSGGLGSIPGVGVGRG